ncbi:MAG: cupredoxin domain-containing protein [Rhizobiales bacterium]|nr:cupredoxin domain-containing protein [Hyphomicrobiales bacterium]MBI3673084.1 cupredoxin domain-containing protein [Hyphomicrobiales bacterium]
MSVTAAPSFRLALGLACLLSLAAPALAEDPVIYELSLKGTAFTPAEFEVPADKAFIIKFSNGNAAPAELEAKELNIEKVAPGNSVIIVRVKAQRPGKYLFVDEFQENVAKGTVIVK